MHNFSTVLGFELVRTLKRRSFWIIALMFPIIIGVVFAIVYFSNKATDDASNKLTNQKFSIQITDESGLIKPEVISALGAKIVTDKAVGIRNVQTGKVDAYLYYPKDLAKKPIETYGKDVGIFQDGRYAGIAQSLLSTSVDPSISPAQKLIIQGKVASISTIYRDGAEYDPYKQMILPGIFLILFYFLIAFFGNQMLTSTTEEKENRVIEMLLTTVETKTLIVGKIIALVILAFLQGLIVIVPALVGYLLFHDKLNLPSFDLSTLPVDWAQIGIGAAIFLLSFLMFTGLLVFVGAMVPTAKEAGQFFGIIMLLIFGPLYAVTLFISAPQSSFVTFLTLFPFTAPIPLLLRNAVGNLTGWETALALVILAVTTVIVMAFAVRAFRYGALEYSRKLSFKELVR